MTLDELRKQIDHLDEEILSLLNQRMDVVHQVGVLKKNTKAKIYRPEREKAIIDRLDGISKGKMSRAAIEAVYLEIFAVSRNLELPEKIAFLGPEGSFTHQAAEERYGALSIYKPLSSIKAVFEEVSRDWARFGVVPLENNQEGIVAETIDLLGAYDLNIVAEVPLTVHFCLASQSANTKDIKKIYSKDIAFRQCKNYLEEHFPSDIELIPSESTSKAIIEAIADPHAAAICAHFGAKQYQLPIMDESIEDAAKDHKTRFVIIAKDFINEPSGDDKTSVLARTRNSPGALVELLEEFGDAGINLSKIESRPAKNGKNFKYVFYIDFQGHWQDANVQSVVEKYGEDIKLLGSYVRLI